MDEPTQPVRPAPRLLLGAAEAERIAAVYDVRTYPLPPGDLLGQDVFNNDWRDYERHDRAIEQAIAPHWNSAVDLLRGSDGYLTLVRLRDRLATHVAQLSVEIEQRSLPSVIARSALRVLTYEAKRHGEDSKIGASLADRPPSADEDGWTWEPRWSLVQEHRPVVPGARPALLALRSAYVDNLVAMSDRDDTGTFVEFDRELTWAEAAERASSTESRFQPERRDRIKVVDLAEFRLKVVEQVLLEHELLGHVDEYGVGGARRVALDEEQVAFVQAALSAIHAVESEVADGIASAPSWDAVRKRIGDETGWGTTRTERAATKLGAYEKHVGSGRPTADQVRSRYEQFRERIVALADPAGAGGWDESA